MNDEALQAALAEMLDTTGSVYGGVSFARALPELKLAIVWAFRIDHRGVCGLSADYADR